jgi:diguanylate cyclase (GGDEF)-like protein
MTIRRTAPLIVLALTALIAGTLATVKVATDSLLHHRATTKAERWAHYVADNVDDLEQIAAGEQPSVASMAFFQWSMRVGTVFRYEIYNRQGFSQLVADQQRTALVDVSEFKPDAAAAAKSRVISAALKEAERDDLPAFFGEAYVPVVAHDRTIAVVAAYVDETEERGHIVHTFLLAAGGLCALTSLAFVVPAGAWYRRTLEKERADAQIEFLARHDGMTSLANRPHLNERLTEVLDRAVRARREIALLHLDIDHFKDINDRFDHQIGDAVLKLVGDRIRETTGPEDLIARIAGDEFVIVQTDIAGAAETERLAQRLVEIMSHPFLVGGREIAATASVGVALAPRDGRDLERLTRSAELALDRCKAEGGNGRRFFTLDLDIELQQRLRLETRIREAAANEEFDLHVQPLVDIVDERTTGFEALLRLRAADGSVIPPSTFIPIAEQTGQIARIGAWVIRQACHTAAQWPEGLTIAVNLSPAQFDGTVCEVVRAALEDSGLDPARLQLEITESLLLEDTESVMAQLAQLKALGVAIVMDDFGTGYSSLSYLWRFPFSKIKIDRSFIQNMDNQDGSVETIVRTIINLGHFLQMRVTVEGVEDERQLDLVRELACDEAQGFHFGRPMPVSDVAAHLCLQIAHKPARTHHDPRRILHIVK